jgi:hypothetical protein
VITETPGFTRSSQPWTPFGFPFRTRKTMVEVYGDAFCGSRFCQSAGTSPAFATASTS